MRRQWYGLVVGCWLCSSVLTAHPLGDFFHQHGRKLLAGVGAVLGVSSVAVVGLGAYAAHNLSRASTVVPAPPTLDSGATVCSVLRDGRRCDACQEHGPGQLCWWSSRALIWSQLFDQVSDRLEDQEDGREPLRVLLEMLLHSTQADALKVVEYLPLRTHLNRVQLRKLLRARRYRVLTQRCPQLEQALSDHFGLETKVGEGGLR